MLILDESRGNVDVFQAAKEIILILKDAGHTAYFAGGWVRDHLLGHDSADIDIATDALPEEIVRIFPDHVLVGAQFGVVLVKFYDFQYEVASFRKDVRYENGRKPAEVSLKSSPKEDALRRDFTINGMFYDPLTNTILDFVDGKKDLEKKIIRTIGNPKERFQEDRLRMIRAVRFAYRLGFTIDPETEHAIRQESSTLLPAVSLERIWQEFSKIRQGPHFVDALKKMHALNLLQVIFEPLKNVSVDELQKRLFGLEHASKHIPTILFLCSLFTKQDEDYVLNLPIYLKTSKAEGKWIETLLQAESFFSKLHSIKRSDWVKFMANPRSDICVEFLLTKLPKKRSKYKRKRLKN